MTWNDVQKKSVEMLAEGAKELIDLKPCKWDEAKLPHKSGMYLVRAGGKLLYIGEAKDLCERKYEHNGKNSKKSALRRSIGAEMGLAKPFNKEGEFKISQYLGSKCTIAFICVYVGRKELEEYICRTYQPRLNKLN